MPQSPTEAVSDEAAEPIETLALRAQRGERACFDELAVRMQPRLRAFLIKRVGDEADADDLVQETFIKAQKNLERYDPSYRFSTWLFTIATNLATSHFRKSRPAGSSTELAAPDPEAASLADRDAGALLWRRASEVLKPAQYATLWLRYGEDLDVGDIAERTGRSSVSVRVSLYRARRKLAALAKELN